MAESEQLVTVDIAGSVCVLTLNRPDRMNALNDAARTALRHALAEAAASDSVRAVVITGAGRAFCAGADVGDMAERFTLPPAEIGQRGWARLHRNQQLVLDLHRLGKPTVAAVNGTAAGLGVDIALAGDFIVASPEASFRMSFVARGLVPDGGSAHFLPRRVGIARAKDLVFSGRVVDANEALGMGLADRLVPAADLVGAACAWAAELGAQPPLATALAKGLLNSSLETTLEQSLASSNQAQALCYTSADHRRLVEDFLNKRRK